MFRRFKSQLVLEIMLMSSWIWIAASDNFTPNNQHFLTSLIFVVNPENVKKLEDKVVVSNPRDSEIIQSDVEKGITLTVSTNETRLIVQNNTKSKKESVIHQGSSDNVNTPTKHQFSRQNGKVVESSDNQRVNGISNQIVGNTPQAAIEMVQSYVEDIIKKPDRERPGYIMINSPNPIIINHLATLLSQKYGSNSIVNEPEAVQNFLNQPATERLHTSTHAPRNTAPVLNNMPVFPFQSRFQTNSTGNQFLRSPTLEADYIKQQLSSIADIAVSSGKLINDTVETIPIMALQSTPESILTNISSSEEQIEYLNNNLIQSFFNSSLDALHGMQQNPKVDILLSEAAVNKVNSAYEMENHILTSTPNSFDPIGTALNDAKENLLNIIPKNASSTNTVTFSENLTVYPIQEVHYVQDENYGINFANTNKDDTNSQSSYGEYPYEIPSSSNYLITTGYEDYYEEIDGELILSPTKFMRKSGSASNADFESYEYYENGSNDSNEEIQKFPSKNKNDREWSSGDLGQINNQDRLIYEDFPFNIHSFLNGDDGQTPHNESSGLRGSSSGEGLLHRLTTESLEYGGFNHTGEDVHEGISFTRLSNSNLTLEQEPNTKTTTEKYQLNHPGRQTNFQSTYGNNITVPSSDLTSEEINIEQLKFHELKHENSGSPMIVISPEILYYLTKLSPKDLQKLGFSNDLNVTVNQTNNTREVHTTLISEENAKASNISRNNGKQKSKQAGEIYSESDNQSNNITQNSNNNHFHGRPNFSAGNFRQSDISRQQINSHFFPSRPPPGTHHLGPTNEVHPHHQLSSEQEQIISRLPVGMQHVVTSIVQALQVPTHTTSTVPPPIYPYPYPYPPAHYFPYFNQLYSSQIPSSNGLINHETHQVSPNSHGSNIDHGNDNQGHHGEHSHSNHGHHSHSNHVNHSNNNYVQHSNSGHESNHYHVAHDIHDNNESQNKKNTSNEYFNPISTNVNQNQGINQDNADYQRTNINGEVYRQNNHINRETGIGWTNNPILVNSVPTLKPDITISEENTSQNSFPNEFPTFRPAVNPIISQSRLGVLEEAGQSNPVEESGPEFNAASVRVNQNQRPVVKQTCSNSGSTGGSCENRLRLGGPPTRPDKNQGLLQLRQDASHMGNGNHADTGIVNYRPPQASTMQMGSPALNVALPETSSILPSMEQGPLIGQNPSREATQAPITQATDVMDRQEVNSLLQSLFSSPTLLLLGIIFATSAAYMAIAMEEQAAQQRFQQAQLAAAFGGQPFPPGHKRRSFYENFETKRYLRFR